jgi:NTE family protein
VIGALYCAGYSAQNIEEIARALRRSHWIDFSLSKMGLLAGKKLEDLMRLYTKDKTFADCDPPLQLVAADIERGVEAVLNSGLLVPAVRATASIPGIFSPVVIEGRILVDGGIINRVPVSVLQNVPGIEYCVTVAVDVGVELAPRVQSMFDVLFQTFDIMARELRHCQPVQADVVIEPHLEFNRDSYVSHVDEIIRAGEEAAEACVPRIEHLLRQPQGGVR